MTLHEQFRPLLQRLANSGIENPLRELRLLTAFVLDVTSDQILFAPPVILSPDELLRLSNLVDRRCQHEPVAKIVGKKEFWGLEFMVTQDTLDPRPDSEILVEVALSLVSDTIPQKILDLGTGSGCLILSLLNERPLCYGIGVDISKPALEVAQFNADHLNLTERISFVQSNWFDAVEGAFDVILANPPYIGRHERLDPETLYDPESALFANEEGLSEYRHILHRAKSFMTQDAVLIFEIGSTQAKAVQDIAQKEGYQSYGLYQDLAARDRCVVFKK